MVVILPNKIAEIRTFGHPLVIWVRRTGLSFLLRGQKRKKKMKSSVQTVRGDWLNPGQRTIDTMHTHKGFLEDRVFSAKHIGRRIDFGSMAFGLFERSEIEFSFHDVWVESCAFAGCAVKSGPVGWGLTEVNESVFIDTRLKQIPLKKSKFTQCKFHGTEFMSCKMEDCTFEGCTFVDSWFYNVDFFGTNEFIDCEFMGAVFVWPTFPDRADQASLVIRGEDTLVVSARYLKPPAQLSQSLGGVIKISPEVVGSSAEEDVSLSRVFTFGELGEIERIKSAMSGAVTPFPDPRTVADFDPKEEAAPIPPYERFLAKPKKQDKALARIPTVRIIQPPGRDYASNFQKAFKSSPSKKAHLFGTLRGIQEIEKCQSH